MDDSSVAAPLETDPLGGGKPKKKDAKSVSFARPVFATEFFTPESKENFDKRPAWQRHLVKRLIDHGDLKRAAKEADVSTYVSKLVDHKKAETKSIRQSLAEGGIDAESITAHLKECLEANAVAFDKHRNPVHFVDLKVKLLALRLICQLRGDLIYRADEDDKKSKAAGIVDLFEDTKLEPPDS